ncbi:MAG: M20/M25/M40 family metallo-hydrolase [Anaerolineae bacterium]
MWRVLCTRLMVAVIVLAICCVPRATADPQGDLPKPLVAVAYTDNRDLARISALGIEVLDLQPRLVAALATRDEQSALQGLGLEVRVLDAEGVASPTAYYLVVPGPDGELALPNVRAAILDYAEEAVIAKALPEEIEAVVAAGASVQRLAGPIVLPTAGPSLATTHLSALAYSSAVQRMIGEVSQQPLHDTVRDLQDSDILREWDALQSRHSSHSGLGVERGYIRERMRELGGEVLDLPFDLYSSPQYNLETTLEGWGPDPEVVYIICAHYDSTSNHPTYDVAPGADDNASGIAGMLEAARILSRYRFEQTIRLVAFAAEEQGLVGSQTYAEAARASGVQVGGVINLDMIGWDSDGDDLMDVNVGPRTDSQALGDRFVEVLDVYDIALQPVYSTHPLTIRSDHASFWNQDYPAMLATEHSADHNPFYHTTNDTLAALNLPYATRLVQATVATVAHLAGIIPPGLRVEQSGPRTVASGQQFRLAIEYSNPGPDPATGVVLDASLGSDLIYEFDDSGLPAERTAEGVRWSVGHLAPHARETFWLTLWCAPEYTGADIRSTAAIAGSVAWDDVSDNQSTWTAAAARYAHALYLPALHRGG